MILAGDVGGTKILLEVGDSRTGRWEPGFSRRFATEGAENFSEVLGAFLDEWNASQPSGARITAAAFGVAGPAIGNKVKMTNRPWTLDGDALASRFRIPRLRVVNDLAATAHGIDWVASGECITIQPGEPAPDAPRVVLGVGTGLGVSYLVPIDGRWHALAGEGGHAGFAPSTPAQSRLWQSVFEAYGRVSAEMVVSGAGLANCYAFLRGQGVHASNAGERPLPERISQAALEENDALCNAALDLFVECLGTVAGDHAISAMARGGVYLTGGIVSKLVARLQHGRFREAFCAKSPFDSVLMRIPVRAVTSERVALLGAARLAAAL